MAAPLVTIDVKRQFSLPFGVPPDLTLAETSTYCTDLAASTGWLEFTYKDNDPALNDIDPGLPKDRRVALLSRSVGANAIVVPRTTDIIGLPAGVLAGGVLTTARIADIGKPSWTPAVPAGADPLPVIHAARFRWDFAAKAAAVLPQPFHTDDALAVVMDPSGPVSTIGADLQGVLDDDNATYLLTTTAAARDGELDALLLRAPALGLARFERYRHIEATMSGATITRLAVVAQSAAGAMHVRVLPDALTPPADSLAPLLKEHTFVYEHLEVEAVATCLASTVWMQFLRFAEFVALTKFAEPVRRQCTRALRCWHASEILGFGAAGSSGLAANMLVLITSASTPDNKKLAAIINAVTANAAMKSGLRDFIVQTYSHLLAGKSWTELGVNFPVAPAGRAATQAWAHAALEEVTMATDTSLVVYAGCPLGRPATLYPYAPTVANKAELLTKGVSTFDLEALVLAGQAASVFAGVTPPALPADRTGTIDLTAYAGTAEGRLTAVRIVEEKRTRAFTTRDALRERITGWNRRVEIVSRFDFGPLAAANHPLVEASGWDNFSAARTARTSMDALHTATSAGKALGQQIVDFWVSAAGFGTGIDWPVQLPGVPAATLRAGPRMPYLRGDTTAGDGGFDVFDLDAALTAADFLRSGGDVTKAPNLAVILALLEREGYRRNSLWQRAGPFGLVFRDNLNSITDAGVSAASRNDSGRAGFARTIWGLSTFGLDVLDFRLLPDRVAVASVPNWPTFVRRRLAELLQRSIDAGVVVGVDPARMKEYTLARIIGRSDPGTTVLQASLLSRQLQWIGTVVQHGEFQRRHLLMRLGAAAGPLDSFWLPNAGGTILPAAAEMPPEYTAPPPAPGADAESAERYDYLAYYSFLYLAFNGSPSVARSWIRVVNANRGAVPATRYFLYKITDAEALSGALVANPVNPVTGSTLRELWHRGHVLRFIVALDAYLRIEAMDTAAVVRPNPPWDK